MYMPVLIVRADINQSGIIEGKDYIVYNYYHIDRMDKTYLIIADNDNNLKVVNAEDFTVIKDLT